MYTFSILTKKLLSLFRNRSLDSKEPLKLRSEKSGGGKLKTLKMNEMKRSFFTLLLMLSWIPLTGVAQTSSSEAEGPIFRRFEYDIYHIGGGYQSPSGGFSTHHELRYNLRCRPIDIGVEFHTMGQLFGYWEKLYPEYIQTTPEANSPTLGVSLTSNYNFRRGHVVAPFAGIGIGYGYYSMEYPAHLSPSGKWESIPQEFALFSLRAGVEFWEHLRLMLAARFGHQGYYNVGLTFGITIGGGIKNAPNGQRFFYGKSRKHSAQAQDFWDKHPEQAPKQENRTQLYYMGDPEIDHELLVRRWEVGGDLMLGYQVRPSDFTYAFNFELRYNLRKLPIHIGLRFHSGLFEGERRSIEGEWYIERRHSVSQNGLSVVSDYNFKRGRPINPFVGLGVGLDILDYYEDVTKNHLTTQESYANLGSGFSLGGALFSLRGGVELAHHLRFTAEVRLATHGHHSFLVGIGGHFGGGLRVK